MTSALIDFSNATVALAKGAAPSIVAVEARQARASGFVWKPGLVATAEEALPKDGPVGVAMNGGTERKAEILGRDAATGLALLKLDADAGVPVKLDAAPDVGSVTLVVGARGADSQVAMGIVARKGAAWQSVRGGDIDARLELDVKLRRNMEGGLAFTAQGSAFGMVLAGPRRSVLVIPSATIERVLPRLQEHGRIPRGYLGLSLQRVPIEGQDKLGSMIVSVDPKGPGAEAGLHQGDVLVSWNGIPTEEAGMLSRALGPASIGKVVDLGIRRAGELHVKKVTIGERPAA